MIFAPGAVVLQPFFVWLWGFCPLKKFRGVGPGVLAAGTDWCLNDINSDFVWRSMSVTSKLTRIIQLIRSLVFFRVDYKLLYKLYIPGYHLITKQTLISLLVSTQTHSSYFQRCAHVWLDTVTKLGQNNPCQIKPKEKSWLTWQSLLWLFIALLLTEFILGFWHDMTFLQAFLHRQRIGETGAKSNRGEM